MKKSLLIVVKDYAEFKVICEKQTLQYIGNNFSISIASLPEINIKNLTTETGIDINYIDWWPKSEKFKQRVSYWLSSQCFFIANSSKSESCRQKSLINIASLLNLTFKKSINYLPFVNIFVNSSVLYKILSLISRPCQTLRKKSRKPLFNSQTPFDLIVFLRQSSISNIRFMEKYSNSKTKTILLSRNIDIPYLKGSYSTPVDLTITLDDFTADGFRNLHKRWESGRVVSLNDIEYTHKSNSSKVLDNNFNFMFATSDPMLNPSDPESASIIYKELQKVYGCNFQFTIRLIKTDKKSRYLQLLKNKNVYIEEWNIEEPLDLLDIVAFKDNLCKYRYVFSSTSTLVLESVKLGVKSAFVSIDPNVKWVYRREHMQYMINKFNIALLENKKSIREFVKLDIN